MRREMRILIKTVVKCCQATDSASLPTYISIINDRLLLSFTLVSPKPIQSKAQTRKKGWAVLKVDRWITRRSLKHSCHPHQDSQLKNHSRRRRMQQYRYNFLSCHYIYSPDFLHLTDSGPLFLPRFQNQSLQRLLALALVSLLSYLNPLPFIRHCFFRLLLGQCLIDLVVSQFLISLVLIH